MLPLCGAGPADDRAERSPVCFRRRRTKAQGLLKRIQALAAKIHLSLARNDKRLKNAEIMLSNTSFRLKEMLNASDYEDRPLVQQTLAKVNDAQDEAMLQVFQQ